MLRDWVEGAKLIRLRPSSKIRNYFTAWAEGGAGGWVRLFSGGSL